MDVAHGPWPPGARLFSGLGGVIPLSKRKKSRAAAAAPRAHGVAE